MNIKEYLKTNKMRYQDFAEKYCININYLHSASKHNWELKENKDGLLLITKTGKETQLSDGKKPEKKIKSLIGHGEMEFHEFYKRKNMTMKKIAEYYNISKNTIQNFNRHKYLVEEDEKGARVRTDKYSSNYFYLRVGKGRGYLRSRKRNKPLDLSKYVCSFPHTHIAHEWMAIR